ncbi:MAG: DNA-binding domain-containing protein [Verrucomicrobiota bacterium]
MKPSKPTGSSKVSSRRDLLNLQRQVGGAIMRPLTPRWKMSPAARAVVAKFIKPNDRLTGFERLELYNWQYWYRLIDCLYDDYPGVRAILGERPFSKLCRDYLIRHPSTSYTLRNLGRQLPQFVRPPLARDMARLEWARIVAFDAEERPVVTADDLLDTKPDRLRLALQPYVTLLKLRYPLDDFLIALKRLNTEALRGEASNAVTSTKRKRVQTLRRPRPETVHVAVHRINNAIYYKRLTPAQFALLRALQAGRTLTQACARAGNPDELQRWFGTWAAFGWFCRRATRKSLI